MNGERRVCRAYYEDERTVCIEAQGDFRDSVPDCLLYTSSFHLSIISLLFDKDLVICDIVFADKADSILYINNQKRESEKERRTC